MESLSDEAILHELSSLRTWNTRVWSLGQDFLLPTYLCCPSLPLSQLGHLLCTDQLTHAIRVLYITALHNDCSRDERESKHERTR